MKKCLLLLLLIFSICACQKKQRHYQCSQSVYYISFGVGVTFSDFDSATLHTIILSRYKGGTDLGTLIETDTIHCDNFTFKGDTAYAGLDYRGYDSALFSVIGGVDYTVSLPAAGKRFLITGTSSGPAQYTWVQDHPCSPGAGSPAIAPYGNIHVDGDLVSPYTTQTNNYFICLKAD